MGSPAEPSPGPRDETRSESGGGPEFLSIAANERWRAGMPPSVEATKEILWDQVMARDRRIRVLEAKLGALQTLAEHRGDEAMLILLGVPDGE